MRFVTKLAQAAVESPTGADLARRGWKPKMVAPRTGRFPHYMDARVTNEESNRLEVCRKVDQISANRP
jgi:hypothetical protein